MKPIVRRLLFAAALLAVLVLPAHNRGAARADNEYSLYLPWVQRPAAPCPIQPELLSPAPAAALPSVAPLFRWNAGNYPEAMGLVLQVATDRAFGHVVLTFNTAQARGVGEWRFAENLSPSTTYYWRTRLDCALSSGPWTAERSFITGSGGAVLPAPALLAPAEGAVLSPLPVLLEWSAVPGAVQYGVFWRQAGASQWSCQWVADNRFTLTAPAPNTAYEWWAVAYSGYAVSAHSPTRHFQTRPSSFPG